MRMQYEKQQGSSFSQLAIGLLLVCSLSVLPVLARPVSEVRGTWDSMIVAPPKEQAAAAAARGLADPGLLWSQCDVVPRFGQVCVGVYGDPTAVPATLGVEFIVLNRTFLIPVVGAQACLDDASILALLAHDPKLRPLLKSLQILIAAEKLVAAEAVSWCMSFTNTFVERTKQGSIELGACPILQVHVGCLAARCVYKHEKDYRCFDVELPHRHGRAPVHSILEA